MQRPNAPTREWAEITKKIQIRKTRLQDIDKIHKIKLEEFPDPWKKDFFLRELSHNIAYFYVAETLKKREIIGYILFWVFSNTLEIHDIAVKKRYQRRGVGSELVNAMLEIAGSNNVKEIFLEVRKSNTAAIKFYDKFNFKRIRERTNYYKNPLEDALVLGLYLF